MFGNVYSTSVCPCNFFMMSNVAAGSLSDDQQWHSEKEKSPQISGFFSDLVHDLHDGTPGGPRARSLSEDMERMRWVPDPSDLGRGDLLVWMWGRLTWHTYLIVSFIVCALLIAAAVLAGASIWPDSELPAGLKPPRGEYEGPLSYAVRARTTGLPTHPALPATHERLEEQGIPTRPLSSPLRRLI